MFDEINEMNINRLLAEEFIQTRLGEHTDTPENIAKLAGCLDDIERSVETKKKPVVDVL